LSRVYPQLAEALGTIRQSLHGQRDQRKTAIFEKVHQATATHWLRKPRLVAGKIGQVPMVGQGVNRSFLNNIRRMAKSQADRHKSLLRTVLSNTISRNATI
jgi:hypothetical protein